MIEQQYRYARNLDIALHSLLARQCKVVAYTCDTGRVYESEALHCRKHRYQVANCDVCEMVRFNTQFIGNTARIVAARYSQYDKRIQVDLVFSARVYVVSRVTFFLDDVLIISTVDGELDELVNC